MTPDYILYKTVMRVYNIKDSFLPNKMIYDKLYVSNYTIYKERKDINISRTPKLLVGFLNYSRDEYRLNI